MSKKMEAPERLAQLLRSGEGETVEFKTRFDEGVGETVSAFANTKGGTIAVGVADDGKVVGVEATEPEVRSWINRIMDGTEGRVTPSFETVEAEGKRVVLIDVPKVSHLVRWRGRPYVRVGPTNRPMSAEEEQRRALEAAGLTWDEIPEPRASLDDLDEEKFERFRRLCNKMGRRTIPEEESMEEAFPKLGLLDREGRLLRAAVLLFGRDPQRLYPQASVKVGRFRSETEIVDDREIGGTLFEQVEGIMAYFKERLETRFEIEGRPERRVVWEYPLDALREAIVNAVCHRDYVVSSQIQVRLFDDKLVFINPGPLPEGITV